MASLRWIVRNRAWSWWYLVRYWRFMIFRLRGRGIDSLPSARITTDDNQT